MRYIDLFRDNRPASRFTVPDHVSGQTQIFRLSGAAQTGGNAMQLGETNMRTHVEQNGPLSLRNSKAVVPSLCHAVSHLHSQGFIHRDIKPENLVWQGHKQDAPPMIDFGIAKRLGGWLVKMIESLTLDGMETLRKQAQIRFVS